MPTISIRVLNAPITNPSPDRRRYGLCAREFWPAGRYICSASPKTGVVHTVQVSGCSPHTHCASDIQGKAGEDIIAAILANSYEVEPEGFDEVYRVARRGAKPEAILEALFKNGVVSADALAAAADEVNRK